MNLRQIANSITSGVNPNIEAIMRINTGFVVDDAGEQVASFIEEPVVIQTQSLSTKDLEHLNLVAQQGQFLYAYTNGRVSALRRALGKGSERLIFKPYGENAVVEWVVTQVIESYPNWVRVLLWRQ
ncbi:hypothetical protein AAEX37_01958 [Oligella sp. MSHR50489EDL]|uniref:hypothetical protein n=1 Tax=Oligella sp. MSHR50489EDL TaxID=3139409 RepID=UPI003D816629